MSTRCMIGYKDTNSDHKDIKAIYCHHDGYLSGVGAYLNAWYRDPRKVRQLMELGSISSLGAFPISETEYKEVVVKGVPGGTRFDGGIFGNHDMIACDDYAATEGIERNEAHTFESEDDYIESLVDSDREYLYLFKDGEWYVTNETWSGFDKVSDRLGK